MSLATVKNFKDLLLVNCHEIPETICVQTRFVTQMLEKPKHNECVFHVTNKNGNFELARLDQVAVIKNPTAVFKLPTPTPSTQAKLATSQFLPSVQQNQPKSSTIVTLASSITNLNYKDGITAGCTTSVLTSPAAGNKLSHTVGIPINNTSQQTFNHNTTNLPITTMPTVNIINSMRSFNDQMQQTEVSALNVKSIAVQCKLDEEDLDIEDEWTPMAEEYVQNEESSGTEIFDFLEFVNNNSTRHNNHKECLICGELSKSNKYFYGHMAIHRGPKILCFKCGQYLENEQLLRQHSCGKAKQLENAFLQCPHHSCGVVAISRLELYDHINEHNNNRMYKCTACHKGFCTGQEFLRHLLIRPNCYTSVKYKRFRVYGLESQRDRVCRVRVFTLHTFKQCTTLVKSFLSQRVTKRGKCKICLQSFANRSIFKRHRIKCLTKFRKRLMRKRIGRENANRFK